MKSPTALAASTGLRSRRTGFWLSCFAAVVLLGLSLAMVYPADPPEIPYAQVAHSIASDLSDGTNHEATADAPILANLHRFALNAFLVPLLEDSVPARWTDVVVQFMCGPGTSIWVDGQPMVPGDPIPPHAFTVRWVMDSCSPFGQESVELSGGVELMVSHTHAGFSAVVKPDQLKVDSQMGQAWLQGQFTAETSQGAPARAGQSKTVHPR